MSKTTKTSLRSFQSPLRLQNLHAHFPMEGVTKIENEDGPILRLLTNFGNGWSVQVSTLAQKLSAWPVSYRRRDLRVWSPKKEMKMD